MADFKVDKSGFHGDRLAGGKTAQAAVGADDPMAGNQQRDFIGGENPAHGPSGIGISGLGGQLAIGNPSPRRNPAAAA